MYGIGINNSDGKGNSSPTNVIKQWRDSPKAGGSTFSNLVWWNPWVENIRVLNRVHDNDRDGEPIDISTETYEEDLNFIGPPSRYNVEKMNEVKTVWSPNTAERKNREAQEEIERALRAWSSNGSSPVAASKDKFSKDE